MATQPAHQIIRQTILTAPRYTTIITCTCGRKIARTNSLKIAERKAEYHLEVARTEG